MMNVPAKFRRLLAVVWFSVAAVIPAAFALYLDAKPITPLEFFLVCGLPVIIAGLCGFVLGARILDPGAVGRPAAAALCGMWVMALMFILYVAGVSVAAGSGEAFVTLFLAGILFVGWLLLIVGAASGWLLYKVSRRAA
jgi:hypothetical protein